MHDMTCVCDAVMLCSVVFDDVWISCCMMMCIYVSCAGLLCLIGRDGLFWPIRPGVWTVRRNLFGRGRFALNEERWFSLVNRVLALHVT